MESTDPKSSVELTTPRRPRPSRVESPHLEPGRKRVRRASLVWQNLERSRRPAPSPRKAKEMPAELSPIMFNDIEKELSSKSGELDAKLRRTRDSYRRGLYGDGCGSKMLQNAEDAVQESSMANEQLILESIVKEPVSSAWESSEKVDVISLMDVPHQRCDTPDKEAPDGVCAGSTWRDCTAEEGDMHVQGGAGDVSAGVFPDVSLSLGYVEVPDRETHGGMESPVYGRQSRIWGCVDDQLEVRRLNSTVAALKRELELRNEEIRSLRDKNNEAELINKKKYEQICMMKNIIRVLKQDLVFMHERYRAEKNSTEALDHEEAELLLERARSLAESLKKIYDEETSRLRSECDVCQRKNKEVCAELAGYKKIVKELVTRIRREKSAADLVYDLRKDLG